MFTNRLQKMYESGIYMYNFKTIIRVIKKQQPKKEWDINEKLELQISNILHFGNDESDKIISWVQAIAYRAC